MGGDPSVGAVLGGIARLWLSPGIRTRRQAMRFSRMSLEPVAR